MTGIENYNQMNAISAYQSKVNDKKTEGTKEASKYGKTIGEPELSKEGAKYYEQLKKKFGQYDFVLVSESEKANAQANASKYANGMKTVVLIDEAKIEKMATDKEFRKKYENILSGAGQQLEQLKSSMVPSGAPIEGYGIQVNDDGTTTLFAVLKKQGDAQAKRIEAKQEKKLEEKKAAKKAEAKEAAKERIENAREKAKDSDVKVEDDDTVTLTANSVEELIKKIEEYTFSMRSDSVMTEAEAAVGGNIDFAG